MSYAENMGFLVGLVSKDMVFEYYCSLYLAQLLAIIAFFLFNADFSVSLVSRLMQDLSCNFCRYNKQIFYII